MTNPISSYIDANISFHHIRFEKPTSKPNPHIHDAFELIFLKKGNITYSVNEKKYELTDNSLIITRPHKIHSIEFNNQDVYDRYVMIFNEYMIFPEIYNKLPSDLDVLSFESPQKFISLFDKIDFYYQHFDGESFKNILFNLIEEIFYNIIVVYNFYPDTAICNKCTVNPILANVIEYIDKNVTNKFSLDSLCNDLHISKSYLNKLFAQHFKISPKKYINQTRLTLMQKELRAKARPTDIYQKYGFSDYSTFYREYINLFGYSPSEESRGKIATKTI